jgi:hypothetical protein
LQKILSAFFVSKRQFSHSALSTKIETSGEELRDLGARWQIKQASKQSGHFSQYPYSYFQKACVVE